MTIEVVTDRGLKEVDGERAVLDYYAMERAQRVNDDGVTPRVFETEMDQIGAACLDALRDHFREEPLEPGSITAMPSVSGFPELDAMAVIGHQFDNLICDDEIRRVLSWAYTKYQPKPQMGQVDGAPYRNREGGP